MTRNVRLTLAGARSARAAGTRSAAARFFRPLGLGRGGRFIPEPRLELHLDLGEVLRVVGLEVARMGPLEAGLDHPPDLPVDVAEMIVDGRVLGLELDRAFEVLDRLLVIANPIIGPSERVDDIA